MQIAFDFDRYTNSCVILEWVFSGMSKKKIINFPRCRVANSKKLVE